MSYPKQSTNVKNYVLNSHVRHFTKLFLFFLQSFTVCANGEFVFYKLLQYSQVDDIILITY